MPTVEWVNARGIKMIKHYTYDKGGVSKANARAKSLREQGLKPKVSHKTGRGYKALGGGKMKRVGSSAELSPPHRRTFKPHPSKSKKTKKKSY